MNTLYRTHEDLFYTKEELYKSFCELKQDNETECNTFAEYLENCMDYNNGTLEISDPSWYRDIVNNELHYLTDLFPYFHLLEDSEGNLIGKIAVYNTYEELKHNNIAGVYNYSICLSRYTHDSDDSRVLINGIYYYFNGDDSSYID